LIEGVVGDVVLGVATALDVVVHEGDFEPNTTEERRKAVRALVWAREEDEHMP
jgi:hypothetical protein